MASPDENSSGINIVDMNNLEREPSVKSTVSLPPELDREWKENKPNYGLSHFMKYLLRSGKLADVTFVVKKENGQTENIMAHQSILKLKSDYFAAMFSGRWGINNNQVDLTNMNITSNDFRAFLEFLYTEKTTLTADNVMSLYCLANMYRINELKHQCESFLEENVHEDNALSLFNVVYRHDEKSTSSVLVTLVAFINRHGDCMLEKPEMLDFCKAQLAVIFSCREEFKSSGLKLLRFCLRWTIKYFGREKLQNYTELDEFFRDELKLWRRRDFPQLCSLLDFDEKRDKDKKSAKKPVQPDTVYKFERFRSVTDVNKWCYRRNRADRVSVRCTEPIVLTGIGLYGDYMDGRYPFEKRFCAIADEEKPPTKYDVDLRIYPHGKEHKTIHHSMLSGGKDIDKNCGIYKLGFSPVYLQSDEWYTISVKISGPNTYAGRSGKKESLIRCGNTPVIIEFQEASAKDEAAILSNPTGVTVGQIPELHFKLASSQDEDDVKVLEQ